MRHRFLLVLLLLGLPNVSHAQVRLSEQASVKQVLNGTTITIEYYRPAARGRDTLFGKVVHWKETWTPGANWATTLETDRDIHLNGHLVPKGKYSVWMITSKDSAWTFFLSKNARVFHTRRPKGTDDDVTRFKVAPQTGAYMETLMWYFPTIQRDASVLRMHWGTTMIDMRVQTGAMPRAELADGQRDAFVGKWLLTYDGADSERIEILAEGPKLIIRSVAEKPEDVYSGELIPVSPTEFRMGMHEKDEVVEVMEDPIVFKLDGAQAVSFEIIKADTKKVMARGERAK